MGKEADMVQNEQLKPTQHQIENWQLTFNKDPGGTSDSFLYSPAYWAVTAKIAKYWASSERALRTRQSASFCHHV